MSVAVRYSSYVAGLDTARDDAFVQIRPMS